MIPAIANAIYDAVGVRIDEVPITPDKVLKGLELKRQGKPRPRGPGAAPALHVQGAASSVESAFGQPADAIAHAVRAVRADDCGSPSLMMRLPPFTYWRPDGRPTPRALMAEHGPDAMLVAGGTDLYPNMKRRQFEPTRAGGPARHPGAAAACRGAARDGLRIGAGTDAHRRCSRHPEHGARTIPRWRRPPALVSSPQLRNMGTLGGNVCVDTRCNYYNQSYAVAEGDRLLHEEGRRHLPGGAGQLRAAGRCRRRTRRRCCGAWAHRSRLVGPAGERTMPIARALSGRRHRVPGQAARRGPDRASRCPPADGWRSAYLKLRRRGSFDFPVLGVAVALRHGAATSCARRASCWARWRRCRARRTEAAAVLVGQRLEPELIARGRRARRRAGEAARQHRLHAPLPQEDDARVRRARAAPARRARRHRTPDPVIEEGRVTALGERIKALRAGARAAAAAARREGGADAEHGVADRVGPAHALAQHAGPASPTRSACPSPRSSTAARRAAST